MTPFIKKKKTLKYNVVEILQLQFFGKTSERILLIMIKLIMKVHESNVI